MSSHDTESFPLEALQGKFWQYIYISNNRNAFGAHINMLLECPPMILKAFPRKLFRGNSVMHITKLFHVIL